MSGMGDVGVIGEGELRRSQRELTTDRSEEDKQEQRVEIVHEEQVRRYDPGAVFQLDLNSDDSDDDE